jgi:L-aspartate oxidase
VVHHFDILVIGSGLAGQSAALRLANTHKVGLISKRGLEDSASGWAQGGIAAVLDSQDSIEAHIQDTITAGAYLNDPVATRFVIENGRRAIEWLIDQGVPFTRDNSGYHLTREGGHSARRVIHVADMTGLAVQNTLTKKVRENPNITVLEQHIAIDLITGEKLGLPDNRCYGAYALDSDSGDVLTIGAQHTSDRHRWSRQGLSLYNESRHLDRRRDCDGVARRVPDFKHGVHPVPSNLPLSSTGQVLPDLGSGPRRRWTALPS